MIDWPLPVDPQEGLSWGVGHRGDRRLAKFLLQRHRIGDIEAAMGRREVRDELAAREGKVQGIDSDTTRSVPS
jgi:hypothetical protein